jgi:hypothetical protein
MSQTVEALRPLFKEYEDAIEHVEQLRARIALKVANDNVIILDHKKPIEDVEKVLADSKSEAKYKKSCEQVKKALTVRPHTRSFLLRLMSMNTIASKRVLGFSMLDRMLIDRVAVSCTRCVHGAGNAAVVYGARGRTVSTDGLRYL